MTRNYLFLASLGVNITLSLLSGCAATPEYRMSPDADNRAYFKGDRTAVPPTGRPGRIDPEFLQMMLNDREYWQPSAPIEYERTPSPFYYGPGVRNQMPAFTCSTNTYGGQTTTRCTPY